MTITEFISLLFGGGVLGALITAFAERGKKRADAADVIAKAAAALVEPLEGRVSTLEAQLKQMRNTLGEKDTTIRLLGEEVEKLRRDMAALSTSGDLKDARITSLEALLRGKDAEIAGLNRRVKELELEDAQLTPPTVAPNAL